jgi:heme/copper-type cytochrome/quinol oxidase subunit 4
MSRQIIPWFLSMLAFLTLMPIFFLTVFLQMDEKNRNKWSLILMLTASVVFIVATVMYLNDYTWTKILFDGRYR